MEKLWKKISGLFFAAAMAVTLTGKANAENDEAALPEPAPTAVMENAAEASAPVQEAPAPREEPAPAPASAEEESAPAAEEESAPAAEEESAPVEEEPAPASQAPEEGAFAEAEAAAPVRRLAVRSVGSVSAAAGAAADGADGEVGEGEPAEPSSDTETAPAEELILVGDMEPQQVISEKDLVIKTAGLQHISSLQSEGDVYIVGTGIVLLDRVHLPDNRSVYLQSFEKIYGENGGTAALFLRTGRSDGMNTYELINSTYEDTDGEHVVPAILDEEYVIPEGINLVVPDGGEIVMQSTVVLHEEGVDENNDPISVTSYFLTDDAARRLNNGTCTSVVSSPSLTITEGARLTLESGASVQCAEIAYGIYSATPIFHVNGDLSLGEGVELSDADITFGPRGTMSGTGLITESTITVQGRRGKKSNLPPPDLNLNVAAISIYLDGNDADLGSLHVLPDRLYVSQFGNSVWSSGLVFSGAPSIKDVNIAQDGTLHVRSTNDDGDNGYFGCNDSLAVTGNMSGGGSILLDTGVFTVAAGAAVEDGFRVGFDGDLVTVYDYTGKVAFDASGVNNPLPRFESGTPASALDSIPVYVLTTGGTYSGGLGGVIYFAEVWSSKETDPFTGSQVTYDAVCSLVGEADMLYEYVWAVDTVLPRRIVLEVCADGVYSYVPLNSSSAPVPAANVQRILVMGENFRSNGQGGGTSTSTNTAYTGSGILGGSGAGSVSGGPRRLALTGNRGESAQPAEDDPLPDDPEGPAGPADVLRIWTSAAEDGRYELHFQIRGESVTRLAAPMTVRMAYTPAPGEESKPLYAVFRDAEGKLAVFEARFDPVTGSLVFDTDMAGCFLVVAFEFDGDPFSEDFFLALAEIAEIKAFLA